MDWRLVYLYLGFAKEKLYGVKREADSEKPDLERLKKMKLGKIIRPGQRNG